jgi:hypothetical protein
MSRADDDAPRVVRMSAKGTSVESRLRERARREKAEAKRLKREQRRLEKRGEWPFVGGQIESGYRPKRGKR